MSKRLLFGCLIALTRIALCADDANAPIDVAAFKPPIRVACVGDSITHGVGATAGMAWPDQLDRMLGENWDVRNFGHSGATATKRVKNAYDSLSEYKEALAYHPDVVVILLGTNDSKPDVWDKEKFPASYNELLVSFKKLSSRPRIFCAYPPYVAKKGAFGINEPVVLEIIPLIQRLAGDWGAGTIDTHSPTKKDEWFKDNVHPNNDGATAIATTVYKALAGKDWAGEIPPASKKNRASIVLVENPGRLTYRDCFALIASSGIPKEKLEPIRAKFEENSGVIEAKMAEYDVKLKDVETQRSKFKHDPSENGQKLYGEARALSKKLPSEREQYEKSTNAELVALVPEEYRGEFGAAWLNHYITDRLRPIVLTLTPEQRKSIREACAARGAAFGKITNTPERSIAEVEAYKAVYESILDADQKKRVDPQ